MKHRTYLVTFPSGFQRVVSSALTRAVKGVRIERELDGAVVFRAAVSAQKVAELHFCQNAFQVLRVYDDPGRRPGGRRGKNPLKAMMQIVAGTPGKKISHLLGVGQIRSFRVVTSMENRLTSPDHALLKAVEHTLQAATQARVARSGADREFWFLYRREGQGFFLLRLTRRRATEKSLHKGQLKPEVAHLLCLLSEPQADDVMLDPFCGFGAIVFERAGCFPFARVIGIDRDPVKIQLVRRGLSRAPEPFRSDGVIVERADSTDLSHIADGSIGKIVTDPPWGVYDGTGEGTAGLYKKVFTQLQRVVCPGGIIVLLLSREGPFESTILPELTAFSVESRDEVLISGKKALVLKLRKRS